MADNSVRYVEVPVDGRVHGDFARKNNFLITILLSRSSCFSHSTAGKSIAVLQGVRPYLATNPQILPYIKVVLIHPPTYFLDFPSFSRNGTSFFFALGRASLPWPTFGRRFRPGFPSRKRRPYF
jgi:hypothetical protein